MVPYNEGLYPGDDAYMIWQDQDFSLKGFALSFENPTRRQSEHWESITNFWRDEMPGINEVAPPHKLTFDEGRKK